MAARRCYPAFINNFEDIDIDNMPRLLSEPEGSNSSSPSTDAVKDENT